ncbi:hypothetical protein WS70_26265 [Burkholderia mayonis]|uniref:Uncharacterized protein n=1 Tax=Burkholderia mayonis TaxID=1385591 RepID=A0A1B4FNI9_9BURK|nr:hypothetical protein WS70_26265 [Burkholderia mayonis]KVE37043.1 hypothetical protein WS69_02485 [Burkholderia sp. BDU5]KVE44899.1 hypothetical protein WS70_06020 [Burkholderia mayonis]
MGACDSMTVTAENGNACRMRGACDTTIDRSIRAHATCCARRRLHVEDATRIFGRHFDAMF